MILASCCFAVMGVFVKYSVQDLPFLVAVFFRAFIGCMVLFAYFRFKGLSMGARQHGLLLLRSIYGFTALTMFFYAIEHLPLANAVVLNFSSPVFVVIMSGLILGESRTGKVLPFVLIAFLGTAMLVSPDLTALKVELDALIGLMSAFFAALAYISVKRLSLTESSATIVLYFSMYASAFGLVSLALSFVFGWGGLSVDAVLPVLADPLNLVVLCGIGLAATLGQVLLTSSYSIGRASVVSGFAYINPVLSYFLGMLLFDEVPSVKALAGGFIVIAACVGVLMVSGEHDRQLTNE